MRHAISAEKFGILLRPVRIDDAAVIVELRNSRHALKYIGDSAKTVAAQEQWLEDYFDRADDYTFIIEAVEPRRVVGMLGIYNIEGNTGEWGRWVLQPGCLAGPASAWLVLQICYDVLQLEQVCGCVVESNTQVISFHKRAGYVDKGLHPVPRLIGGKEVRMVELATTRSDWPKVSQTLHQVAVIAQKFLNSGYAC